MDEYIDIKIDVFEHTSQRAQVRKNLTVSMLIEEILKEFDDVSADSPGKYALYLKGSNRALSRTLTLTQLDIQPQDELVFNYGQRSSHQMLMTSNYAMLRDTTTGRIYQIQWQPALIGRPTNEADHNINLAVNLQTHPKGQTISRKHASITCAQGRYFIEPLADKNPTAVNGHPVPFRSIKEIRSGDIITVGRDGLQLVFQAPNPESPHPQLQPKPANQPNYPVPLSSEAVSKTPTGTARQSILFVMERAGNMSRAGQKLEVPSLPFILGRDHPLISGEGEVSRHHAEINQDAATGKFFITDINSTNGVSIEGVRIEANRPYELRPGNRIGLGEKVLLRVEIK